MLATNTSRTVIGSLSKEGHLIRTRTKNIMNSIINSKDEYLLYRLKKELNYLNNRRSEIIKIALFIRTHGVVDELGIEFLIELCDRPIV